MHDTTSRARARVQLYFSRYIYKVYIYCRQMAVGETALACVHHVVHFSANECIGELFPIALFQN